MVFAACGLQSGSLPQVVVDRDNVVITQSCVVTIPDGLVLADADNNGVIQIAADGITVEFRGAILRGAAPGTPWDQLTGVGVRLNGHSNVTLNGLHVHGFKVGVWASDADGLSFIGGDLSDNYRKRLGSTPEREDSSDWMSPHNNDNDEWIQRYGGALYIQNSDGVTVRNLRVRRGQNGILLSNVNDSKIYDNDVSFLTGWGIGMWRSSRNTVTRNAADFCVRGHVEGVYNRGQDSAGILMFEQCSNNIIAQNSATHGGDGIFGFGGLDALGQRERDQARERLRRETGEQNVDAQITFADDVIEAHRRLGCNDNIFAHNDLSYAPAHGLEMTFSFGNIIYRNRLVENAICGIWGGFSQDTIIFENLFDGNGGMTYGLERGAINIEHGAGNIVIANQFINNRAGIHYWWDGLGDFESLPWAKANYRGVVDNIIADNRFVLNDDPRPFHRWGQNEKRLGYHFRNDGGQFENVTVVNNFYDISGVGEKMVINGDCTVLETGAIPALSVPTYEVLGETRPVTINADGIPESARAHLRGRDKIIMDEWGPWDFESPLVRRLSAAGGEAVYEVLGVPGSLDVQSKGNNINVEVTTGTLPNSHKVVIRGGEGVSTYAVQLSGEGFEREMSGTLIRARWLGRVFSWKDKVDPREDFEGWLKLARATDSRPFGASTIDFKFGWGGPKDMVRDGFMDDTSGKLGEVEIGNDRFGLEAVGRLRMPAGAWRVRTVSDDGIRVSVAVGEGEDVRIIDNWTHHGPTPDEGRFVVDQDNALVIIKVLYFEIDGYSMLTFELTPDR